jgi:hypothetical protein
VYRILGPIYDKKKNWRILTNKTNKEIYAMVNPPPHNRDNKVK